MAKNIDTRYLDKRIRENYLKKGIISESDINAYLKDLPNEENNFELVMITDDEIGVGDELSDEEISSMPEITEDNIDNFDFEDDLENNAAEQTTKDAND
ncbi:MAG: hypothetical protein HQM16_01970 [Deltaproteobacteria bacterium]|nr:hypothetical protein [Deltaproteobacteria bacterium]